MSDIEQRVALFVGGPCDGERRQFHGGLMPVYRVDKMDPPPANLFGTEGVLDRPAKTEVIEYRLMKLAGSTKTYHVYALGTLTGDQVMERLIDNYGRKL